MRVDEAVTVGSFHAAYASLVYEGLTSNAIAAYDRAWRLRLAPSLGGVPLTELTALAISRARADWNGSASTKQDALALLSRLLGLAVMGGLIGSNPSGQRALAGLAFTGLRVGETGRPPVGGNRRGSGTDDCAAHVLT